MAGRVTLRRSSVVALLLALLPTMVMAVPGEAAGGRRTATEVLAHLSMSQKVGQLLMVGTASTRLDRGSVALVRRYHLGGVVLIGNSARGVRATARITSKLQARARPGTDGVRLLVAADQEGGNVQHLKGPGFSRMPSALGMGRWATPAVRSHATRWGRQLRRAGVNLDLAPVLDTVPRARRQVNQPIGRWDREFGFSADRVRRKGVAFARGLLDSRLGAALKHFPGLGRVRGNTDSSGGVTDTVTRRHDRYVEPFAGGVKAGAQFVMLSSARYARIDRHHIAPFSKTVIRGMLRHDLGFEGVVMSDSLSSAQLAPWRPGRRAVLFVEAGGDLALTTSHSDLAAMYRELLNRARSHPRFARLVDAAALRILRAKESLGLL